MLIGEFNRYFSRHGKWVFFGIGLIVCVGMLLYFGPDSQSVFNAGSGDKNVVCYVDDRVVDQREMQLHITRLYFFYTVQQPYVAMIMGFDEEMVWPQIDSTIRRSTVTSSWRDAAPAAFSELSLAAAAAKYGADQVTPQELADYIRAMPVMRVNDKFSRARYDRFIKSFEDAGLTPADFDNVVRQQIVSMRMRNIVVDGFSVTDSFARRRAAYSAVMSTVELNRFDAFRYLGDIQITDAQVEAAYQKEKAGRYILPEHRSVTLALVPGGDIEMARIPVSEEELRTDYETKKEALFTVTTVTAREIFKSFDNVSSDEDREALLAQLRALAEQARGGADFGELAKTHSDAIFTKRNGGLMQAFTKDQNPKAAVVFTLKDGEISAPQISADGARIYLRESSVDSVQPFETVRDVLANQRRARVNDAKLGEAAYALYQQRKAEFDKMPQAKISHLLLRVPPMADDAEVASTKERILAYKQQAEAQNNFPDLVISKSEAADKKLAGELGWVSVDGDTLGNAVKDLPKGAISEPVRTSQGWEIVWKQDERAGTPYAAVEADLRAELEEQRLNSGRQTAQSLLSSVHDALGRTEQPAAEVLTAQVTSSGYKTEIRILRSEPFERSDDHITVKTLDGDDTRVLNNPALAEAAFDQITKTRRNASLQEVKMQDKTYYVIMVADPDRDVTPPQIRELDQALSDQIRLDLQTEAAKAKAREDARAFAKSFGEALAAGKSFDEAKGEASFTQRTFRLNVTPGFADGDVIRSAAERSKAGTMAGTFDTANGAVVVYVADHSLPTESELESAMAYEPEMTRNELLRAALEQYGKDIEAAYPVMLTETWSSLAPETQADVPVTN